MTVDEVLAALRREAMSEIREGMTRYAIPNDRAFGVSVRAMRALAKRIGTDHALAAALWGTGWYEARTVAGYIDDPAQVLPSQMDAWAHDFDNWAICDTTCFSLFDRTPFAWGKVPEWADAPQEFVRRAAYALIWSLSVHDKTASDDAFLDGLALIEAAPPDPRIYVRKAMDMALRAVGKRNRALNAAAINTAQRMAASADKTRSWIGRHALRELESDGVQARLAKGRSGKTRAPSGM